MHTRTSVFALQLSLNCLQMKVVVLCMMYVCGGGGGVVLDLLAVNSEY